MLFVKYIDVTSAFQTRFGSSEIDTTTLLYDNVRLDVWLAAD